GRRPARHHRSPGRRTAGRRGAAAARSAGSDRGARQGWPDAACPPEDEAVSHEKSSSAHLQLQENCRLADEWTDSERRSLPVLPLAVLKGIATTPISPTAEPRPALTLLFSICSPFLRLSTRRGLGSASV